MATEGICNGATTIQRALSIGQAVPILGPAIVSPIKAIVSLIEGIAAGILYGVGKAFDKCFNKGWGESEFTRLSKCLAVHAAVNLCYSIVNMATLGLAGLYLELNNHSREQQWKNSFGYQYCQTFNVVPHRFGY